MKGSEEKEALSRAPDAPPAPRQQPPFHSAERCGAACDVRASGPMDGEVDSEGTCVRSGGAPFIDPLQWALPVSQQPCAVPGPVCSEPAAPPRPRPCPRPL